MISSKTLAILGAGKLGVVVAQLALKAGYSVYIAGSGSPEKIELSMNVLAPGAIVTTATAAAAHSDKVLLALPLSRYQTLPKQALAGKLVIDAMNYWWEVDGELSRLPGFKTSTSEMVQDFLSESSVVKAISHIGYHHLHDEAKPLGASDRKAIAIAGDDPNDRTIVARIINDLGFDPLIIGDLAKGKILEPGHPAFGAHQTKDQLAVLLGATELAEI